MFLGEIFQIQTKTINGWPYPTRVKNFWPGPITSRELIDQVRLGIKRGLMGWVIKNKKCWDPYVLSAFIS